MSILLSWAQIVHPALLALLVVMALHPIQCNPIKIWSPLLFHDQDTASPPFPQRKELVAQVARIYWPHLISATMVQPGSLFLSLHFITAFVIMQAPRHPFLEARAISQSSIWLCDLSYGFWTLSLVLSLSIGSTGAWVWVYILYTGAWVWVYILLASSRAIGQRYSLRQIQKVSRYCLCVLPSAFTVNMISINYYLVFGKNLDAPA